MKKNILPLALMLMGATACSSNSTTTTPTPSTTTTPVAPSIAYSNSVGTTSSDTGIDATSSATVLKAEESYGDSSYHVIYKHSDSGEFLLQSTPSAEDMVLSALSVPFVVDSVIPLEILHQSVRESMGTGYETLKDLMIADGIIEEYATSRHYGISEIESFVPYPSGVTVENVVETVISGDITCQSARLYLPKLDSVDAKEYLIVTLLEIQIDADNIYTYLEVGSATISTYNTDMALEFLHDTLKELEATYGLQFTKPEIIDPDQLELDPIDPDQLELDAMTSATPEFHYISNINASGEDVTTEVGHFPNKMAYLDYSAFDVATAIGIAGQYEQVVIQEDMPSILKDGINNDIDLSVMMANGDFSAVAALEPGVIFLNSAFLSHYDTLSAIAPVVVVEESATYEEYLEMVDRISVMYSVQYLTDAFVADYLPRLDALADVAQGKSGLVVSAKDGVLSIVTDNVTLAFHQLNLTQLGENKNNQEISLEEIETWNPDYLFVLDFDGSFPSTERTTISLDVPAWTQLGNGILGMNQMISDLEKGIL